jgi:hypothetical protein
MNAALQGLSLWKNAIVAGGMKVMATCLESVLCVVSWQL